MTSSRARERIGHVNVQCSWICQIGRGGFWYLRGVMTFQKKVVLLNIVHCAHCSAQETTATWPAWRMGCGPFLRPCASWCVEHPPSSPTPISRPLAAEKTSTKWARSASTNANQVTTSLDPPENRGSTWNTKAMPSAWFRKPRVKMILGRGCLSQIPFAIGNSMEQFLHADSCAVSVWAPSSLRLLWKSWPVLKKQTLP